MNHRNENSDAFEKKNYKKQRLSTLCSVTTCNRFEVRRIVLGPPETDSFQNDILVPQRFTNVDSCIFIFFICFLKYHFN
jgi:hypothetical protein